MSVATEEQPPARAVEAPPMDAESITPRPATATARRSRNLALACTLSLIVLGLAWELWLAPTGSKSLALKVLPLAFTVAGLARFRMKTYRWMSLLVWLYFAEGAMRAFSDQGLSAKLAAMELTLSLVLFGACVWHVRQRLIEAKAANAAAA